MNTPRDCGSSNLTFALSEDGIKKFSQIFQGGVVIQGAVGCTIMDLLFRRYGIDRQYIDTRIQTIFLDGKAVDDPESARIADRSTLALSAAMPGFVGATLRRDGHYAVMRSNITHRVQGEAVQGEDGLFTLKLFNLLAEELAPVFLRKGIWIRWKSLKSFLELQGENFINRCGWVRFNDEVVGFPRLLEIVEQAEDDLVRLDVVTCKVDAAAFGDPS